METFITEIVALYEELGAIIFWWATARLVFFLIIWIFLLYYTWRGLVWCLLNWRMVVSVILGIALPAMFIFLILVNPLEYRG